MNTKSKSEKGKGIIGITLAAIMVVSIFAIVAPTTVAKYNPPIPPGTEANSSIRIYGDLWPQGNAPERYGNWAQPCDHNVNVLDVCCENTQTWGWFYNETTKWVYSTADYTPLFHLNVDGEDYYAYCINYEAPLTPGDTFNASIYAAEPTCKNNSIAYILNNWTIDCTHCDNVSAGQSAVWYFTYIKEIFCRGGTPEYNHTAEPPVESNWIPNCAVHPEACDFINASINQSVPYNVTITPKTGSYVTGTPIPLEATVDYCDGEGREEVTVVFEADNCNCNFNGGNVNETETVGGIANAILTCDASVDSVNVTARVKDMKWFEIVVPCNGYQETLRIVNITDDANFSFYEVTPGEVDGYVYEDPNCNCTYDQGEKGVENVTVELVNATTVVATKTNGNGYYEFTGVPAGDYTVRYNAGDLYVNGIPPYRTPKCDDGGGSPTEGSVTVPEGGSARHNFGVELVPDIAIDKLVNGKDSIIAERNDTVTFTLIVTNTGIVNLTNLSVTDALPDKLPNRGLTWTGWADPPADGAASSTDLSGWIHFTIHWWGYDTTIGHLAQFEPLEPGESFEITFNATVDPDAKGRYKNVGYVTAESEWGDVSDDHSALVIVGVPPEKVPVLTPFGVAALIGLLSLVAVLGISKSKGMRRKKR
jgi:uncharacterized repeat protein (TIGR01451 family)